MASLKWHFGISFLSEILCSKIPLLCATVFSTTVAEFPPILQPVDATTTRNCELRIVT